MSTAPVNNTTAQGAGTPPAGGGGAHQGTNAPARSATPAANTVFFNAFPAIRGWVGNFFNTVPIAFGARPYGHNRHHNHNHHNHNQYGQQPMVYGQPIIFGPQPMVYGPAPRYGFFGSRPQQKESNPLVDLNPFELGSKIATGKGIFS